MSIATFETDRTMPLEGDGIRVEAPKVVARLIRSGQDVIPLFSFVKRVVAHIANDDDGRCDELLGCCERLGALLRNWDAEPVGLDTSYGQQVAAACRKLHYMISDPLNQLELGNVEVVLSSIELVAECREPVGK